MACAALPEGCHDSVVSRLYLGRGSPQGEVGDEAWNRFVADTVSVRFPAGFTVFDARGQWRADDGQVQREATQVLEIVHDGAPAAQARIAAIAAEYRRRFAQEAVLVTHGPVRSCGVSNR